MQAEETMSKRRVRFGAERLEDRAAASVLFPLGLSWPVSADMTAELAADEANGDSLAGHAWQNLRAGVLGAGTMPRGEDV